LEFVVKICVIALKIVCAVQGLRDIAKTLGKSDWDQRRSMQWKSKLDFA